MDTDSGRLQIGEGMKGDALGIVTGAVVPRGRRTPLVFKADPLLFFGACHAVLWLAGAYLFHQQGVGAFPSDTRAHAAYALGEVEVPGSAYSLLHVILRMLVAFAGLFGADDVIDTYVILMTLTMVASMVMTSVLLVSYFNRYAEQWPWLAGFAPLLLVLVSMLVIPGGGDALYIGIGTPNPWHNPTYIFAKPFSIAVFILVLQVYSDALENRQSTLCLIGLACFAVFSMWAKPSFLMSFLPAVACYFLWKCASKHLSLKSMLIVGVALLPSLVPLVGIESAVYGRTSGEEGGIVFTLGEVWRLYTKSIPLSILVGMAFPLYVLAIHRTKITSTMALALVNYVIATLIYFLLAEKGFRFTHANFSWGYLFGMYFLFLAAIETFFFRPVGGQIVRAVGWVLLAGHSLSGLYYFLKLLKGGAYL